MHTRSIRAMGAAFGAALILGLGLGATAPAQAVEVNTNKDLITVRAGVLKFGTVNWELNVIKEHHLDEKYGINLEITGLTGKNPSAVAIQAGAVDIIVSDYIWVSRLRSDGADFVFVPHSLAVGGLIVREDSGINTIADLEGRKLGIAGGPVDKSWVLLQAYYKKTTGRDLKPSVKPQFGAPPLLNELTTTGKLPAVLNFWHYNARLKGAGHRQIIGVAEILKELGVEGEAPLLGWVFHEAWANENPKAINGFLRASRDAKQILRDSDAEWDRLRSVMKAPDDAIFVSLRTDYRKGIVSSMGPESEATAAKVFAILAEIGGEQLVGSSSTLAPNTFWANVGF